MQILDNIKVLNSYDCFSNEQLAPLVRRRTLVLLNNFPLLFPEVHVKHAQQLASQGCKDIVTGKWLGWVCSVSRLVSEQKLRKNICIFLPHEKESPSLQKTVLH